MCYLFRLHLAYLNRRLDEEEEEKESEDSGEEDSPKPKKKRRKVDLTASDDHPLRAAIHEAAKNVTSHKRGKAKSGRAASPDE